MAAERSELAPSQQGEVGMFTWRVTALSEQTEEELYSDTFTVGGVSWRMSLYPKGDGDGAGSHLTLFLAMCDTDLPYGWSCPASYKLVLKSQTDEKHDAVQKNSNDVQFHCLGSRRSGRRRVATGSWRFLVPIQVAGGAQVHYRQPEVVTYTTGSRRCSARFSAGSAARPCGARRPAA
jgi:hypothetical protein